MQTAKIFSLGGSGGSVSTGSLQIAGGVALDTTLRYVTDQANTASPLQLSTTRVNVAGLLSIGTTATPSDTTSGGLYLTNHIVFRGPDATARTQLAIIFSNTVNSRNAAIGSGWYTAEDQNLEFITASSLRGVWDKTGNLVVGTTTASARLHVRGDGTNPIARFENSGAVSIFRTTSGGFSESSAIIGGGYSVGTRLVTADIYRNIGGYGIFVSTISTDWPNYQHTFAPNANSIFTVAPQESGVAGIADFRFGTFGINYTGGNTLDYRGINISYTINNGNANARTATGIFLNATETALNGMTHNLMDLQLGGVSRFKVLNSGDVVQTNSLYITGAGQFVSSAYFRGPNAYYKLGEGGVDGTALFLNSAGTSFDRLMLGGTTNAFPAIKRNGADISFRKADDSTNTNIYCRSVINEETEFLFFKNDFGFEFKNLSNVQVLSLYSDRAVFGIGTGDASARLEIQSTTKGFLLPRMTSSQRNSISSPATSLMIFNTDSNQFNYWDGTAWKAIVGV